MVSADCNLILFKWSTKDNAPLISIIPVLMATAGHNRLSSAQFASCSEDKGKSDCNYGSASALTLPSSRNGAAFRLSSAISLRSRLCHIVSPWAQEWWTSTKLANFHAFANVLVNVLILPPRKQPSRLFACVKEKFAQCTAWTRLVADVTRVTAQ